MILSFRAAIRSFACCAARRPNLGIEAIAAAFGVLSSALLSSSSTAGGGVFALLAVSGSSLTFSDGSSSASYHVSLVDYTALTLGNLFSFFVLSSI